MTVTILSDYSEIDRHLSQLEDLPRGKGKLLLDAVLETGFAMTQADVHVQTGALKATGEHDTEVHDATDTWEGTIEYGSPGDNGPVDYAIYEKERDLGGAGGESDAKGSHDFFGRLPTLDPLYRAAIKEAMRP
jgi:hypothetical protein